jgi:hypothetical protein
MPSQALAYVRDVHRSFATYWPTWMPTTPVSIGDCGTLDRGIFVPRGSVSELGVPRAALRTRRMRRREPTLECYSESGVRVRLQAAGQGGIAGIPIGRAGGKITFSQANASLLAAVGVREHAIAERLRLEQELKALVQTQLLSPDWVVVTDVVTARSGRALVSAGPASITLSATAKASTGPFQVASLGGELSIAAQTGGIMSFDGTDGMTPLFRVIGFNVGSAIRRARRRILARRKGIPRIVVKSIGERPRVGTQLVVNPVDGQRIGIAPIDGTPFVFESTEVRPFTVEPTLVDVGAIGALLPQDAPFAEHGEAPAGLLMGALDGSPAVGAKVVLQPLADSAVVIDPVDSDPFLVKLIPGQSVSFEPAMLDFSDEVVLATYSAISSEDPLGLDYVDFETEFAELEDAADTEDAPIGVGA